MNGILRPHCPSTGHAVLIQRLDPSWWHHPPLQQITVFDATTLQGNGDHGNTVFPEVRSAAFGAQPFSGGMTPGVVDIPPWQPLAAPSSVRMAPASPHQPQGLMP